MAGGCRTVLRMTVSKQEILDTARRLAEENDDEQTSAIEVAEALSLDPERNHSLLYNTFWSAKERGELRAYWPGGRALPTNIFFF